jgi:hypothetical protein
LSSVDQTADHASSGVAIDGAAVTPAKVRQQFERLRPLKELSV